MTVILSFIAAVRAGDAAARLLLLAMSLASLAAFAGVMIYRHDNRIRAEVIQKIERANDVPKAAADQAEIKRLKCPGVWNREEQTCK